MSRSSTIFKLWLPLAFVGLMAVLLAYVGIQQGYRHGANDPQIQMAEDAASALAAGASPQSVVPAQTVGADSLAPFLIVTDESGKKLAGSTQLSVLPPTGSFDYAKAHAENRLTWQPQGDLRLATVIVHYGGAQPGYVIAARNLREVESRQGDLATMAGLALAGILAGAFLILLVTVRD